MLLVVGCALLSLSVAFSTTRSTTSAPVTALRSIVVEEWDEDFNEIKTAVTVGMQKLERDNGAGANDSFLLRPTTKRRPSALKFLQQTFLPSGYPHSVPAEYIIFQSWNLLQDLCSYLRGIMATKAILIGMGVGRADVTAIQATIHWILRDGASLVGGLLFTSLNSYNFGQNVKLWRLFADMINNVGITLNILAPMSRRWFLPLICIGSLCTALCGVAAGATGAAINAHWGSKGSIAEVLAKNNAQHTAVSLFGLSLSIPFAHFAERIPPLYMWILYTILTTVHMASNYIAMRVLALTSLNIARYELLLDRFLSHTSIQYWIGQFSTKSMHGINADAQAKEDEKISLRSVMKDIDVRTFTPKVIAAEEPIVSLLLPTSWRTRWTSAKQPSRKVLVKKWVSVTEALACSADQNIVINPSVDYLFVPSKLPSTSQSWDTQCSYSLCFARSASTFTQAKAYLHAALLERGLSSICAQQLTEQLFVAFWELLQSAGWTIPSASEREQGNNLRPARASTFAIRQSS